MVRPGVAAWMMIAALSLAGRPVAGEEAASPAAIPGSPAPAAALQIGHGPTEGLLAALAARQADFDRLLDGSGQSVFMHDTQVWYKTSRAIMGVPSTAISGKTFGQDDRVVLTPHDWWCDSPRLSPDRRTLTFYAMNRDHSRRVIVRVAAGQPPAVLMELPPQITAGRYYDVAPDLSEIAFQTRVGDLNQIFRYRFVDGRAEPVSHWNVGGQFPSYSPDGRHIAYVGWRRLRVRNLETDEERIVVNDDLIKELPAWSPDGKWIVYQASNGDQADYDIYKVEVATGKTTRLTSTDFTDAGPCFSADGSRIVFSSRGGEPPSDGHMSLFRMNADGSGVERDPFCPAGIFKPVW